MPLFLLADFVGIGMKRDYGTNGKNWERARLEHMAFQYEYPEPCARDERAPSFFRLFRNLSSSLYPQNPLAQGVLATGMTGCSGRSLSLVDLGIRNDACNPGPKAETGSSAVIIGRRSMVVPNC